MCVVFSIRLNQYDDITGTVDSLVQSRPRLYMYFYHNKYAHTEVEDQHKNWGEDPGLIHCVSGHEVDSRGGEGGGYIQTDACYYQSR